MHPRIVRYIYFAGWMLASSELAAQNQPPLEVLWFSELPNNLTVLDAFFDSYNGRTEVVYSQNPSFNGFCFNEEQWIGYDEHGRPSNPLESWNGCLNANVTHDQYAVGTSRNSFPVLHVINACDLNVINCYIWCNGAQIWGVTTGSPSYSHASAGCVLADGPSVYLGGISSNCSPTGWSVFKLGGGAAWPVCVPVAPRSLEATSDSILSINFPAVHMVDKVTGTVGSAFNLFSGVVFGAGKSCMSGDTLYWACNVNSSLHVGKYVLGQGTIWEQELPFGGVPVELVKDDHARLWTAVGNRLVWLGTGTGNFSSSTLGTVIEGLDLQLGALVVAGTMDTNLNFIMHATPRP